MIENNTLYGLLLIGGSLIGLVFGFWFLFTSYTFYSTCLYELFFNKGVFEVEEVYAIGYEDKELYYQEKDKTNGKHAAQCNLVVQKYLSLKKNSCALLMKTISKLVRSGELLKKESFRL